MATHTHTTNPSPNVLLNEDTPPTEEARAERISLLDLLAVLAERKRLISGITSIFAVGSVIVSLLLPVKYTATVTLMPPQQNTSLSSVLASQLGSLGGVAALAGGSLGMKNPNDMYVGMLTSRTVEDSMIHDFGLMDEYHARLISDARKKLENYAKIDGSTKDGLIHISVQDGSPQRAAELANGYVTEFQKLSSHLAVTEASQRRLFFEQQLEVAKNKLADAEEALKRTEQKTGLIQLDSQSRALIESAAALRAQIAAKEVQLQALGVYATSENSEYQQVQTELNVLRGQLAKLGGSESDAGSGLLVPKGQVPEVGLEYVRKLRDVRYYETIFDILARQFEVAKLDEAKEGSVIQVVDKAVPPDRRSSPQRTLIVALSTLVGLFLALVIALTQAAYQGLRSNTETGPKLDRLQRLLFGKAS